MKLSYITENEWENETPKNNEETYEWMKQKKLAALQQYDILTRKLSAYKKYVIINYDGNFTTPIIFKIHEENAHRWWGVPKGTVNADKIIEAISFYIPKQIKVVKLIGKYSRLTDKFKKLVHKEVIDNLTKSKKESFPSTDVPRKIFYNSKNYFHNPYWEKKEDVIFRYAGSVGHFPTFSSIERQILAEYTRVLERYGLNGFTKLYGCQINNNIVSISGTVIGRKLNLFVAIGADGKIIWRRDGMQNIVYINGKKVPSDIMTRSAAGSDLAKQKEIFEPLNPKSKEIKEGIYPDYKALGLPEPTEWDNHPHVLTDKDMFPSHFFPSRDEQSPESKQYEKEKKNKYLFLKKQMQKIEQKIYDIASEFPEELLVRALPDRYDQDFLDKYSDETIIPLAVQANPDNYTMIEIDGNMFWEDMRKSDEFPDGPCEEYYILKSSPRYQHIVNLLKRYIHLKSVSWNCAALIPVIRI